MLLKCLELTHGVHVNKSSQDYKKLSLVFSHHPGNHKHACTRGPFCRSSRSVLAVVEKPSSAYRLVTWLQAEIQVSCRDQNNERIVAELRLRCEGLVTGYVWKTPTMGVLVGSFPARHLGCLHESRSLVGTGSPSHPACPHTTCVQRWCGKGCRCYTLEHQAIESRGSQGCHGTNWCSFEVSLSTFRTSTSGVCQLGVVSVGNN